MEIGSDGDILAAVKAAIKDRPAAEVIRAFYHQMSPAEAEALDNLAALLPAEQISLVRLTGRLNLTGLAAVTVLLTVLRKLRTDDAWVHYNLAKHLNLLLAAGTPEAKLPAIVHAFVAREGLKDTPNAQPLPLGVLSSELASFAPRQAIRSAMLAARHGDETSFRVAAPAFAALKLDRGNERASVTQLLQLANELQLGPEHIPNLAHTTGIDFADGLRSTAVEAPHRIVFPTIRGDGGHYIFEAAEKPVDLPGITIHSFEGGTFSIDATHRGGEQHYVFDRNGNCVLDLANGSEPFVADTVLEFDVPVAVLDDRFSSAMNICHFLLDRLTRIPLYERAWSRPGKFLLIDDFPYYRDTIARLGFADRIITPPSKRVSIRAPEILFSSNIAADFRHPAHYCADWAIDFLRQAFKVAQAPLDSGRKLMISRADTTGRGILNWAEVEPILRRHGFEIVELARLAPENQIRLFQEASHVVGVHGAGLTNMIFTPPGCAVLEILPPLVAVHDYWLLASALGHRYSALIADDPEMPRPDYKTWRHNDVYNQRDLVLSPGRLELALAALDDRCNSTVLAVPSHRADSADVVDHVPDRHHIEEQVNLSHDNAKGKDVLPDLILCHCSHYTLADVEPFFASFLTLSDVQLCVFASEMDDRFYRLCSNNSIRVEPVMDNVDRRYHLQNGRWFDYNNFIENHGRNYRKIMLTDVRDVFFQSNPFANAFSHEVCFAAEDRTIRNEPNNTRWIMDLYGQEIFDEICDCTITCSGTTLGTVSAIKTYVTIMCQELSWRKYEYSKIYDQGAHNYIAWKIRPEFARVDLEDRVFNTIGMTDPKRVELTDEHKVLVDGVAPPVVHQWDRHPNIKEFVRASPKFRIHQDRDVTLYGF